MVDPEAGGSRWARWRGVVGLAWRRLRGRMADGLFNRVTFTVLVVAVAVALLVVVTGLSLGLASEAGVGAGDADFRVVPESGSTLSSVVAVRDPALGDAHQRARELAALDGVRTATPVLVGVVRLRAPASEAPKYVLGIGVVPPEEPVSVGGLSTAPLTPVDLAAGESTVTAAGDEATGEVLLSPAAADLLNASAGDDLVVGSPASGTVEYSGYGVTAVADSRARGPAGNAPVALFHLRDLQALTGAAEDDQATQLLVWGSESGVKPQLEAAAPGGRVLEQGGLNAGQVFDADLPLAVATAALLVALGVVGLFVATTMGLEVETDRRFFAVLAAVGLAGRSRLAVVAATTVGLAALGGLVGVVLGAGLAVVVNAAVPALVGVPVSIQLSLLVAVYGVGVAVLAGVLAVPYPVAVARRTATSEVLGR